MVQNPDVSQPTQNYKWETPKKGKLRIMPISDSAWAPTGFGTNTKNVSALLTKDGHHIGYGGCQNRSHIPFEIPWPLNQTEKVQVVENLPIQYGGQERYGEKSFPSWVKNFNPDVILTHLDFQMFEHVAQHKQPRQATIALYGDDNKLLSRADRGDMLNDMFKKVSKGSSWKWAAVVPIDGTPPIANWQSAIDQMDYKLCMSRYGQIVMEKNFTGCEDTIYMPHGVDCNFFKPKLNPLYGGKPLKDIAGDAFIVGCVARNQHRKNIPQLVKGFKEFIDRNELEPSDIRLVFHMDWNDSMGWKIPEMCKQYGIDKYLMPPLMGNLDGGEVITEEGMVELYNCLDMFILPTAGEGFGIPTIEAMACGTPVAVTNYTTAWEIIKEDNPETADIPLYPCGGAAGGSESDNGRDTLLPEDICEAGILLPYKDMWWDTPNRAAPQRAICSAIAIADAIDYYYHNPEERLKASQAARKKAKSEYDWVVLEKRWLKLASRWVKECN